MPYVLLLNEIVDNQLEVPKLELLNDFFESQFNEFIGETVWSRRLFVRILLLFLAFLQNLVIVLFLFLCLLFSDRLTIGTLDVFYNKLSV